MVHGTSVTTDFDVAILGSGFSGSITALILQQAGLKTLLIDRVSHPRFAIGESSTPAANLILRSLSDRYSLPVLDTLSRYGSWVESFPEVGCGLKRGFSYFFHRPDEGFVPSHDHRNELLVSASDRDEVSDTQWLRANVDTFLFCRAIDAGAYMIDDAKTTTIERSAETWRIEITRPEQRVRASARFVIDASGSGQAFFRASGRTPRQAKLMTRSRAIFGHFTELPPWDHHIGSAHSGFSTDHPFYCDDAAQHHLLGDAWMWWLRFRDNRTSVGLVLDETAHSFRHGESADVEWNRILMRFPNLFEALRQAAPPYRLAHTRRLQRLNLDVSGPGWALLPHSAGFIDPLHSTGIAHSLSGVERLTRILTESDSVSDRDMRLQQTNLSTYVIAAWPTSIVLSPLLWATSRRPLPGSVVDLSPAKRTCSTFCALMMRP